MKFKAVFLDFYGTLVHEDDDIIPLICERIRENAKFQCTTKEIGSYWWKEFSRIFRDSYGETFQSQRALGIQSLQTTIEQYQSNCVAEELIQKQFAHWTQPKLYSDTLPFIESLHGTPVYIVSNIDGADIAQAIAYHQIEVAEALTSEDVRSYKPRPELFLEALKRSKLDAHEVIHIGDSLLSDVAGAQALGIHAIWLNRLNKTLPEDIQPDYIAHDLDEVRTYVMST